MCRISWLPCVTVALFLLFPMGVSVLRADPWFGQAAGRSRLAGDMQHPPHHPLAASTMPAALRLAARGRSWLRLQPRAWYRAAPRALPLISKNSQQSGDFHHRLSDERRLLAVLSHLPLVAAGACWRRAGAGGIRSPRALGRVKRGGKQGYFHAANVGGRGGASHSSLVPLCHGRGLTRTEVTKVSSLSSQHVREPSTEVLLTLQGLRFSPYTALDICRGHQHCWAAPWACAFCPMPGDAPRKPPPGREQILIPALKDFASMCVRAFIVFLCLQTWGLDRR